MFEKKLDNQYDPSMRDTTYGNDHFGPSDRSLTYVRRACATIVVLGALALGFAPQKYQVAGTYEGRKFEKSEGGRLAQIGVSPKKKVAVDLSDFVIAAEKDLKHVEELGLTHLPICIAKAPSSLSDDPTLHGRPRNFEVTVSSIQINAGAGFLVVLTGNIMRMPGLPKKPAAYDIKLLETGVIEGLE